LSVNSIGSGAALPFGMVAAAGKAPDPEAQKAQVNAQADLLLAVRSANRSSVVAARLSDSARIDVYL